MRESFAPSSDSVAAAPGMSAWLMRGGAWIDDASPRRRRRVWLRRSGLRASGQLRLSALAAAVLRLGVSGQIYAFEDEPIPANKSLHTLYAFYVYSQEEAPGVPVEAPFAKFAGLSAKPTWADDARAPNYRGVQLSLMRYSDFWDLIDPHSFCVADADLKEHPNAVVGQLLLANSPKVKQADVHIHTVHFPGWSGKPPDEEKRGVTTSGVYILIFSNCGDFDAGTVSGTIIVKNAYGYLPGNEYHKLPFYGWLLLVYVALGVAWMVLSIRWWKELNSIQNCIAAVILFGLVESFLWYIFFNDWNTTGTRGKFGFVLAILFTVVKSTYSYMLVLVAALGWGVTRPFLDPQILAKIQVMSVLYIILDFIRETVLSFRHSHALSLAFVLLCLLPVSLLNGAIFYWVFSALSTLMETLKERRQTEKLVLFQRLWSILLAALSVATFSLLFQIYNLSRSIAARWRTQWLLTDGVSHMLFLVVLVAMMYLWAPHKYSQRYSYSQQLDDEDGEGSKVPQAVWVDEDGLDNDEDETESFWATTQSHKSFAATEGRSGGGPRPDVVGAAASDEDRDRMDL